MLLPTGVFTKLTTLPVTTVSSKGQRLQLNCSTDEAYISVNWLYSAPNSDVKEQIYIIWEVTAKFKRKLFVSNSIAGQYNLVINSITEADAGRYFCVDEGGFGEEGYGDLIVILGKSLHIHI